MNNTDDVTLAPLFFRLERENEENKEQERKKQSWSRNVEVEL